MWKDVGVNIVLGNNSGVGINCSIPSDTVIGDNVMMGPNCFIIGLNHNFERTDIPMIKQGATQSKQTVIEDDVWIASHVAVFAHRRVMDDYHKGERYKNCPQKPRPILIKKGACVGIGSLVTPGVTIGRGSVIGAGSVVVKDIPDWCLAAGSPCKVMRFLPEKGYNYNKVTKLNEPIPGYGDDDNEKADN